MRKKASERGRYGRNSIIIARAKPKVPWIRAREYYFPISKLLMEADKEKNLLLADTTRVYQYAPLTEFTLSISYDKPTRIENLDEAFRIGLITKYQYESLSSK